MMIQKLIFAVTAMLSVTCHAQPIHIVFTSDVHYGITRPHFRGRDSVDANTVNNALVATINTLGKDSGYIDYIILGGDIANREEVPLQSASVSWNQFVKGYLEGVHSKNKNGKPTGFFVVPGNHDVSNAVGYYRPMYPEKDASSIAGIYNLMMHPAINKTPETYQYAKDKINHSRDIAGLHFMFLTIWPDSSNRIWMEEDLKNVSASTPVIIFTHDPPEGDPKHFFNPDHVREINATDHFENLLDEVFKDRDIKSTDAEQKGWCDFLKRHSNIKAYFHGHSNYNEFYTYHGLNGDISLPAFRVDSPMKGKLSAGDESKLSFQFISIDTANRNMTVSECLWNQANTIKWGEHITIAL